MPYLAGCRRRPTDPIVVRVLLPRWHLFADGQRRKRQPRITLSSMRNIHIRKMDIGLVYAG